MTNYTMEELTQALRAVSSIIHKCEKAQEKFPEGNSHHTLLRNRLKAMYISRELLTERLSTMEEYRSQRKLTDQECDANVLLSHLEELQITDLGIQRVKKNLMIDTADVTNWCREKIRSTEAVIVRKGKNWYITVDGCVITVNAHSYTIITAHRDKGQAVGKG